MLISYTRELEEQRHGRNKSTAINRTYIESGEFRRKFDAISDDSELNKLLFRLAKKILKHRTGTLYEDMYWIDLETLEIIAQETDKNIEEGIEYSNSTKNAIKDKNNLLTIHSHPNSFPPSISDFRSNYSNNYSIGIIICHNGKIYMYHASEDISERYYNMTVAEYIADGYNDFEAQIKALKEISEKFDIEFKEVTDDDL